jgi:hypothetical protein
MSRVQVYVLGDSISIHYGPHLRSLLDPHFDYDRKGGADNVDDSSFGHEGANGGPSTEVLSFLRRYTGDNPSWGPNLLLLNCGLHDLKTDPQTGKKQVPLEQYRDNLGEISSILAGRGIATAWVRSTPVVDAIHNSRCREFHRFAADVALYNAAADENAANAGWPILDLHNLTLACGERAFCDHVHFVEPVRVLQAQFLAWQVGQLLS